MGLDIPIIGDVISAVKDIVGEVIVDKDKRIEINYKLQELEAQAEERLHEELMGQIEVNKVEAASDSMFVAGWRPFIGWTSGVGVAWTFVASPIVEWISRLNGWMGKMPELDTGQLMALVTAMLGVAGYRTFEKVKGVSTTSMAPTNKTPTATVTTKGDVDAEVQIETNGVKEPKKKKKGFFKKIGRLI
jgi:hypothetical protein